MNDRLIFAMYDEQFIRVYQAFNDQIADEAILLGTFGQAFKRERMTWIKPSFLWMMYRSGWASKEGQLRVLAIDIKRDGFDFIVRNAVPSSFLVSGWPVWCGICLPWQAGRHHSDSRRW